MKKIVAVTASVLVITPVVAGSLYYFANKYALRNSQEPEALRNLRSSGAL